MAGPSRSRLTLVLFTAATLALFADAFANPFVKPKGPGPFAFVLAVLLVEVTVSYALVWRWFRSTRFLGAYFLVNVASWGTFYYLLSFLELGLPINYWALVVLLEVVVVLAEATVLLWLSGHAWISESGVALALPWHHALLASVAGNTCSLALGGIFMILPPTMAWLR